MWKEVEKFGHNGLYNINNLLTLTNIYHYNIIHILNFIYKKVFFIVAWKNKTTQEKICGCDNVRT